MEKYLYLVVNLFALSYPLAQSFEQRIKFSSHWYALFPAILISGTFFLIWDFWFTRMRLGIQSYLFVGNLFL